MNRDQKPFALPLLLVALLSCARVPTAAMPGGASVQGVAYTEDRSTSEPPVQAAQLTPDQLQQLVAPIALYPDGLIAQILAASTYPDQVVEADRWLQQHSTLKGERLAQEVDKQPWDPSVKALTGFPSVLANMDKNLSWTSSLGDAYVNHEQDVMDAIQAMRRRAQKAGNLTTPSHQRIVQEGDTIAIEPADPQVVYVPQYDPWVVYGAPVAVWPGWYAYPGLFLPGPGIAFGLGFDVGFFGGFGWGWPFWGCDWHHRTVIFNHNRFVSHSRTFINRNVFNRARPSFEHPGGFHGAPGFHGGGRGAPAFHGFPQHGFVVPHSQPGTHGGAFSGFDHGGVTRGDAFRGESSFEGGCFHAGGGRGFGGGGFQGGGLHGGGGFHGGGGGFHGGGGHR